MKKVIVYVLCSLALSLFVLPATPTLAADKAADPVVTAKPAVEAGKDAANLKTAVKPSPDDVALTDTIKAQLAADEILRPVDIAVIVEEGCVTLQGEVSNSSQVERAEHVATKTPGVKKVDNQLKVSK